MPLRFLLLASLLLPGMVWGGETAWMYLSVPPEEEAPSETGKPKLVFDYGLKELDGPRVAITCGNPSLGERQVYTSFAFNFEESGISGGPPYGVSIQLQDMEGNLLKQVKKRNGWYTPLYRSSKAFFFDKVKHRLVISGESEITLTFPLASVAMWYFGFGSGDADFVREHERVRYRLKYWAFEWRYDEEDKPSTGGKTEIVTEWREISTAELFSRIPLYDSRPHYRSK